ETMRTLRIGLPRPDHTVLLKQSGTLLLQEIDRLGNGCDFVRIDLAGHDCPTARRGSARVHTLATAVSCPHPAGDALGGYKPASRRLREPGPFAAVVMLLQEERTARGLDAADWVVARNRVRHCEQRLIASTERDLQTMSSQLGFRMIPGLTERL